MKKSPLEVLKELNEEKKKKKKLGFDIKIKEILKEIEEIKKSLNESIEQSLEGDTSMKYAFCFALDIVKQIESKIKKLFPEEENVVVINLDELKEGTCIIKDFGGDKRVICMEEGKLKIFELID